MTRLRPALRLAMSLFAASPVDTVGAHTAAGRALESRAAIAEFRFSGGEPMAYAQIKVFAPGANEPFQIGRADGAGRFAFVPDRTGEWRVEAREDAENHRARLFMTVSSGNAVSVPLNRLWSAILWTSLATNFVLLLVMFSRRRRSETPGAATR